MAPEKSPADEFQQKFISRTRESEIFTKAVAEAVDSPADAGLMVLYLNGPYGIGKTTFLQAMQKKYSYPAVIESPETPQTAALLVFIRSTETARTTHNYIANIERSILYQLMSQVSKGYDTTLTAELEGEDLEGVFLTNVETVARRNIVPVILIDGFDLSNRALFEAMDHVVHSVSERLKGLKKPIIALTGERQFNTLNRYDWSFLKRSIDLDFSFAFSRLTEKETATLLGMDSQDDLAKSIYEYSAGIPELAMDIYRRLLADLKIIGANIQTAVKAVVMEKLLNNAKNARDDLLRVWFGDKFAIGDYVKDLKVLSILRLLPRELLMRAAEYSESLSFSRKAVDEIIQGYNNDGFVIADVAGDVLYPEMRPVLEKALELEDRKTYIRMHLLALSFYFDILAHYPQYSNSVPLALYHAAALDRYEPGNHWLHHILHWLAQTADFPPEEAQSLLEQLSLDRELIEKLSEEQMGEIKKIITQRFIDLTNQESV